MPRLRPTCAYLRTPTKPFLCVAKAGDRQQYITELGHGAARRVSSNEMGEAAGGKSKAHRGRRRRRRLRIDRSGLRVDPAPAQGRLSRHDLSAWLAPRRQGIVRPRRRRSHRGARTPRLAGRDDNAFLLLRQCYEELNGNAKEGVRNWDDLFLTDSHIAAAGPSAQGGWVNWAAHFPPAPGLPGDPIDEHNPFALKNYFGRAVALLRTLLLGMETFRASGDAGSVADGSLGGALDESEAIVARVASLLRFGALASAAVAVEALALVEAALKSVPRVPETPCSSCWRRSQPRFASNLSGSSQATITSGISGKSSI